LARASAPRTRRRSQPMRPDRFQHLYVEIGDTICFEVDEDQILAALKLPDFTFEAMVDLSYRDQLGLALATNYLTYRDLLALGGSDDDGFVFQDVLDARALVRMQTFLQQRSALVHEQIQQHELIEARKRGAVGL